MPRIYLLLLCAAIAIGSSKAIKAIDVLKGPVTNRSNKHIYYLLSAASWTESEAAAARLGGHLATVRSSAENGFITNQFAWFNLAPRDLWIGLNDAKSEGHFVWSSGEPVDFIPKRSPMPTDNSGQEDYVHIMIPTATDAGLWNDFPDAGLPGRAVYGVVEIVPPEMNVEVASIRISWSAEVGRHYQLQATTNVIADQWISELPPILADQSLMSTEVAVYPGVQWFYRVVIRVP
jgi:hypothetical protein